MNVLSIGEILWDNINNERFIGGAPFNFTIHLKDLGHKIYFISAVGDDKLGEKALSIIKNHNLPSNYINIVKEFKTGIVKIMNEKDSTIYDIQRPAAYDFPYLSENKINEIITFNPDWLYIGTMQQMSNTARELTSYLIKKLPKTKIFYDVNLRKGHFTKELIESLLKESSFVKFNLVEARIISDLNGLKLIQLDKFCNWITNKFNLIGVAVTNGSKGYAIKYNRKYFESVGEKKKIINSIGAGDAFSAGLLHGIINDWKIDKISSFANKLAMKVLEKKGAF